MKDRIKELRIHLNLTLKGFGDAIGMTKSGVSNIEKGRSNPSEKAIRAILQTFHVSEEWLRYGKGEMYPDTTWQQEVATYSDLLLADSPKSVRSVMVSYIMHLDAQDLEAIAGIIRKHGFPGSNPSQDNTDKQEEPAP